MNLTAELKKYLVHEKIVSSNDVITFSLSTGDINRKKSALSRRYLVTRNSTPFLIARFIPKGWLFSYDDIAKTYSLYSTLHAVKIPRLIARFSVLEGEFFVEEYLNSPVTLATLIETNQMTPKEGLGILRDIFSDIWRLAEQPTEQFINEEKKKYREFLSTFVQKGVLGDVVLDYVDRVIDQHKKSLKQAWSSGDIMDRNILRSGKDWYLVDFEYSHKTLFLFKDVYRNILYSQLAQGYTIHNILPSMEDFPEDVAKLIALAWDENLQHHIVEEQSHHNLHESVRRMFWNVFDSSLFQRLDKKSVELQHLAEERKNEIVQLQNEVQNQRNTIEQREKQLNNLQQEFITLQQQVQSQTNELRELQTSMSALQKVYDETKDELLKVRHVLEQREKALSAKDEEIAHHQGEIQRANAEINQLKNQAKNQQKSLTSKDRLIAELKMHIEQTEQQQHQVYSSLGFKLLKAFWFVKDSLLSLFFKKKVSSSTPEQPRLSDSSLTVQQQESEGVTDGSSHVDKNDLYESFYSESLRVAQNKTTDDYVPISEENIDTRSLPVKLIAFYLPQFHPIPENDEWWGKGFTEWTNVSKAVPQFEGHYQPRLPGELGFYDLRVPEVQRRQVELAKKYGIYGFCFHYYWFNGKRLLERPLEQFISDPEIDFPFCICWANENWTRRWDGFDQDILIQQVHTKESDIEFIKDVEHILRHKNYIKIDGRPIIIVYRAPLMPKPAETAKRWKAYCKKVGLKEPYLIAAQTFGFIDPREVGFDAAVEFPPHNIGVQDITSSVTLLNSGFAGKVFSFPDMAEKMKVYNSGATYKFFKNVSPSWDNEARKPGRGHVYANSSPEIYRSWLESACHSALQNPNPDERLVFINAWNEWAESAYLEPDKKYGYAYLEMTKQVLKKITNFFPKISVIIPNYNHEQFIVNRIESIVNQSYKPNEIIFLDDASTDNSLHIAENILRRSNINYKIIRNETNSGNVFKQWLKGIENSEGDLIWIAESDDEADVDFLKNIIPSFQRDDVLLAYGNISYIDVNGKINNELENYYDGLSKNHWILSHTRTAQDLFTSDFAIKNIIPNVSGAVFRKPILSNDEIQRLLRYNFAGDWYFYALVSRGGSISYCKEAKSYFRLNQKSTSRREFFTQRHIEEHRMILDDLKSHYEISDKTINRHADELERVLSLNKTLEEKSGKYILKSIYPKNNRKTLNICIASYGFGIGGGELVPVTLANALRNLGHHITFLVLNKGEQHNQLVFRSRLRNDIPVIWWEDHASNFNEMVKDFRFDIINSHNVAFEYTLYKNNIKLNVPYVATLHGGYETVPDIITPEFVSYISKNVYAWLYLADKNIIPLVNNGLTKARFFKVFNAIPPMEQTNDADHNICSRLNLSVDSILLVLASRAIHAKGWEIAIEVTRKLRATTGKDFNLILIGDGEDLEYFKNVASNEPYIHFIGRVPDVRPILKDCNFGIFPSTYVGESFPIFILECFSAGLPVIACDIGAIREMMTTENGETAGAVIPIKQNKDSIVVDMVDAIKNYILNPYKYDSARAQALKRADYYDIKKLIERYLDIFFETTNKKKYDL